MAISCYLPTALYWRNFPSALAFMREPSLISMTYRQFSTYYNYTCVVKVNLERLFLGRGSSEGPRLTSDGFETLVWLNVNNLFLRSQTLLVTSITVTVLNAFTRIIYITDTSCVLCDVRSKAACMFIISFCWFRTITELASYGQERLSSCNSHYQFTQLLNLRHII